MVYRGKPSKACLQCRKRKLRRVRNETQKTRQKALSRIDKPILGNLATTIHERARNAFFVHYVSGFSKTYDVLEFLYKQSSTDKHLIASVDAVSLAFFSFQFDCTPASRISREKYLSALPLLNKALCTPECATSDATLLAVLLLDLFEKITNNNPRSIGSWMSHINGALALVEAREKPELQGHTGRRLSARLSINLLISCISASSPVPPTLVKLRSDLEPFLNKEDPKWQLSGLSVKYANLKGAIQDGCLLSSEIIARATKLDHEFESLAKHMPPTWLYGTTFLDQVSERVLEQRYDTYTDHFIAQAWNVLRVTRMLLNDTMRTYYISLNTDSLDSAHAAGDSASATGYIDSAAKEICASVPQLIGYENSTSRNKTHCTTQKLKCYTLLFPLYVAGLYASSVTQIKPWIIKQLRFMSDELGIRNAKVVAEMLERGRGTCPWDVYAMLGSYAFAA